MSNHPGEKTSKRARSNESNSMAHIEDKLKLLDAKIAEGDRLRKHLSDRAKALAKANHESCEKHRIEQQKQEKNREERKAAKEKRLNTIEAKLDVILFGFEHVKKLAEESINKVNENNDIVKQISDRMDSVLHETVIMRENCEAKDAEILQLHSILNQQEKEIETLKRMLNEQRVMMEMYADINSMNLNRNMNSRPF